MHLLSQKQHKLFIFLTGFFVANTLIAEFMGVKIFSLEKSFGFTPLDLTFLGVEHLSFNLSAGVLLWPIVFVFTDIINEYFGTKGVRMLTFLTAIMIMYGFIMFFASIQLSPADFWIQSHIGADVSEDQKNTILSKVGDYNVAYSLVFGQGLWIILGSISAFLTSQFLDVWIFHRIKQFTGEQKIWLRATGSTIVSQLIDSFVVLFIAFYIGADWSLKHIVVIGLLGYIYKFTVALCMTPILYVVHAQIERYLGKDLADSLKKEAMLASND